jgi:hypothetical protein
MLRAFPLHKRAAETKAMADKKEPQSYGSQGEWVSGKTEQSVNRQDQSSAEDRRQSNASPPHQGGDTSPVQAREHAMPSGPPTDTVRKVSVEESGAKRGGFFKARDYEEKK